MCLQYETDKIEETERFTAYKVYRVLGSLLVSPIFDKFAMASGGYYSVPKPSTVETTSLDYKSRIRLEDIKINEYLNAAGFHFFRKREDAEIYLTKASSSWTGMRFVVVSVDLDPQDVFLKGTTPCRLECGTELYLPTYVATGFRITDKAFKDAINPFCGECKPCA